MDSVTLMIQTCDRYSDLWEHHLRFLAESWPDCPWRILLVTDVPTKWRFPGVEVFAAGAGCHMPARLQAVLPHISTDYVLLTLDDYFPVYPIDTEELRRLVGVMETNNLDYLRLFPDPPSRKKLGAGLYGVNLGVDYGVNLYPGLWRKSFLEATLPGPSDIWAYEVSLTHTARRLGAKCAMTQGAEFPVLDVIRKGKLLHRAARFLRKQGISLPGRAMVPLWEEWRIFLFNHGKRYLSPKLARRLKTWLTKLGFTFYTQQYEAQYDGHSAD